MSINGGTAGLGEISTQPVPPQPRRRRLAAVLALDAVGYSQRMESDEERVYRALLDCRSIMRSSIEKHGGRVAGTPGDFLLALFESGADAVSAALDLQSAIAARNQGLDPEDCLVFRAGIGLGDVIEEYGDAYGSAVNLAARLQTIAAPGHVVVSEAVRALLRDQKSLAFRDLGERQIKHLREPMRVFLVHGAGEVVSIQLAGPEFEEEPATRKPFVGIEPFKSLTSGETAQLFAAGLTDDLLITLSRLTGSIAVHESGLGSPIGPDHYRLEGVVRLLPDRLRVTARLIRCEDSTNVWAERLEFKMDETVDLTETIAREVITTLQITLTEGEQARLWSRRTTSGRAWELFLKGHDLERRYRRESHPEARAWYERSLAEDPSYVVAMIALAFCHIDEVRLGWSAEFASEPRRSRAACGSSGSTRSELPRSAGPSGIHPVRAE